MRYTKEEIHTHLQFIRGSVNYIEDLNSNFGIDLINSPVSIASEMLAFLLMGLEEKIIDEIVHWFYEVFCQFRENENEIEVYTTIISKKFNK